ncbi:MAG: class I SAM-dependent methyltransferase [Gemmatimonadales bacterium]
MSSDRRRPRDPASWDQRYVDGELPWDSGEADVHLGEVIRRHGIEPGKALEIGCGTGTNTIWLARQGFEMTVQDLAPNAIAKAKTKVSAAGVRCNFFVGDFLVDKIPGRPFQFVYDRGVFHVFDAAEEQSLFASRVAELLAPGGMWHSLIGSTDGPPRDTGPPRRSAIEIVAAVEPHFEILELITTTFDQGDHGRARAWVFVARKREV